MKRYYSTAAHAEKVTVPFFRLLGWPVKLTQQADSRWTWFALGALCGAVVLLLLTVVVRRKG